MTKRRMQQQPHDVAAGAMRVLAAVRTTKLSIVTAESCTAGMLSSFLSDAPDSAEHLHGGFVTYTKASKTRSLGVSERLLNEKGSVCTEVAVAMAEGALERSPADLAVAITGVAGPDPDEDGNPVGRVCIAVAQRGQETTRFQANYGRLGRHGVRQRAILDSLRLLLEVV